MVGKAYTALPDPKPGDEFEITLGRKQRRNQITLHVMLPIRCCRSLANQPAGCDNADVA